MAVLRIQENIKKADGTYDAVHKETEAGLVLFDDNETLQQKYDAGELNGKDIYAEAVAKGYTGTEDEFFTMLAKGPWVSRSGDPGLSGGSLKFLDGAYGISIGEITGYPTLTLVNDDGGIAGTPLVIANVESPQGSLDAANKKYVDDAIRKVSTKMITLNIETDKEVKLVHVVCPPRTDGSDGKYSLFYSGSTSSRYSNYATVKVIPPEGYAINKLNESEDFAIRFWYTSNEVYIALGKLQSDGSVLFNFSLNNGMSMNFEFFGKISSYITLEVE